MEDQKEKLKAEFLKLRPEATLAPNIGIEGLTKKIEEAKAEDAEAAKNQGGPPSGDDGSKNAQNPNTSNAPGKAPVKSEFLTKDEFEANKALYNKSGVAIGDHSQLVEFKVKQMQDAESKKLEEENAAIAQKESEEQNAATVYDQRLKKYGPGFIVAENSRTNEQSVFSAITWKGLSIDFDAAKKPTGTRDGWKRVVETPEEVKNLEK